MKEELLCGWRANKVINFITYLVYQIQHTLNIEIIKR